MRIAAVLPVALLTLAQAAPGAQVGAAPPNWAAFVEDYQARVEQAGIAGSGLVLVRDGKVAGEAQAGFQDLEARTPVTRDTIFHWASITKTFTAIAIMQLRDRGLLGLDDPVVKHVPEFARVHNPFGSPADVTLRHLMTHSSGLRAGTWPWSTGESWEPFEPTDWEQLVAMLPYTKLNFAPGSKYSYSNPGIIFLGRIIETLSGDDYEMYVTKNILSPLGMTRSFFDRAPYHLVRHRSRSYTRSDEGLRQERFDFDTGITVSNGGLNAPVTDMAKYLMFLMGDASRQAEFDLVLKRASLDEMFAPLLPAADGEGGTGPDVRIGLNFFVERHVGKEVVAHSGNQNGFISHLYLHRPSRTAYVVSFNTHHTSRAQKRDVTRDLDNALRDRILQEFASP